MLCDCFVGNGDNIVIADPTFLIYEKTSLKCGCRVKKIPLIEYRQDIRGMVSAMDSHTKILFLTSPHNPTGSNISREDFEYALTEAASQALVIIDEAYFEYMPEQLRLDSVSCLDRFPSLVVLRTFSKIFGLAGLRVGYGVADEKIISSMNKIRLPFNVNSLGQAAAIAALRNWESINSVRERVDKEKNKFYKRLGQNKIRYIESCANFLLIETGSQTSQIIEDLLGKGFIVRPGYNLGVDGYIRVTISVPDINDKFLDQFIKIYKKYNN
ncbi:MAG: histidinol-phosphate transaminase [Actinomycetota bacterium]|nr:histidinol-phosphate transaminase [Actinomycetota bacterium]